MLLLKFAWWDARICMHTGHCAERLFAVDKYRWQGPDKSPCNRIKMISDFDGFCAILCGATKKWDKIIFLSWYIGFDPTKSNISRMIKKSLLDPAFLLMIFVKSSSNCRASKYFDNCFKVVNVCLCHLKSIWSIWQVDQNECGTKIPKFILLTHGARCGAIKDDIEKKGINWIVINGELNWKEQQERGSELSPLCVCGVVWNSKHNERVQIVP